MRNVYMATPCYSQMVTTEYALALLKTCDRLKTEEIGYGVSILGGDCFVANARNRLITEFLETECTDLFFIDDDVQFEDQSFLKVLNAPFDIVAGIYPQKFDDNQKRFPVELTCDDGKTLHFIEHDGLTFYKANSLPSGFMRISRAAILKMIEAYPSQYEWPEVGGGTKKHYALFEAGVCHSEGNFHGEDYNFSQKARACGLELWTLPDLNFNHIGKKKYQGNLQTQINLFLEQTKGTQND